MHRRPARAEGNLDQHASSLLPARANDLLGAARVRRLKSVALSHPKRGDACRIGGTALARPSTARRSWRLARRGSMGVAPRDGTISRLGDRAEKYAVLLVLSPVDLLLLKLGEAIADNTDETSRGQFDVRSVAALFRTSDAKQTFRSHVTRRACALCLVAATANPMARRRGSGSVRSYFSACKRLGNMGTEISCGSFSHRNLQPICRFCSQ